jgi:NADH dehydrogenase/putative oxidoreductase
MRSEQPMSATDSKVRRSTRLAPWCEGWADVAGLLAGILGPLISLGVRFWLAQIFFLSGVLKAASWPTTVWLYTAEHPVPGVDPNIAALVGTGIELVCPVFLALGLFTRLAAIPLLLTAIFLQVTYREFTDHLYWIALLGLLIVRGGGALSLDRMVAGHLATSAIPGASAILGLARTVEGVLAPGWEAMIRCGLAWILWNAGFAQTAVPLQVTGAALCILLAVGLALRPSALLLAILGTAAVPASVALGDPMLRLFLLLIFVAHGGGPLSADRLLAPLMHRLCPSLSGDAGWLAEAPRVVIVGAGFGGIAAARALRHAWARVTVVDRRNYHLFQPLLYQVATATLSPADIAVPIRALLRDQPNCRVLMGRVTGVDTEERAVLIRDRRICYDYLVLATGARHSYFGKDEWEAFAPGLKKIDDATAMRSRILAAFERAEASDDEAERRRQMTFVIVGGGPTGVELAGAIAELARQTLKEEFRAADPTTARVILVQSAPRLLPALPESLSAAAARSLQALGVETLTSARAEDIDDMGVTIGNQRIEARTVLWAAGVAASAAGRWISAERDGAGRIIVGNDLAVASLPGVFALGDTAACPGTDGRPLPGLAAVAKQQGQYVAKVIRAATEGRHPPGPFRYRNLGSMATIGRKAAVADLPGLRLSGSLAWWLWGLVHVALLLDLRSRIVVMFDWFWAYLTYNRSMRLITGAEVGTGD